MAGRVLRVAGGGVQFRDMGHGGDGGMVAGMVVRARGRGKDPESQSKCICLAILLGRLKASHEDRRQEPKAFSSHQALVTPLSA